MSTGPPGGPRLAVPASGRLREVALELLSTAGYDVTGLRGRGSTTRTGGLDLIEMRPRDAAAAVAAGALDGAFIATDIALEHGIDDLARKPLGAARSTLVIAARDADGPAAVGDLQGAVVATHLPAITARFLDQAGVEARVLTMGGSLEGACAAGLADAIVDNTETGTSLRQNNLRVLSSIVECEAELVHRPGAGGLDDLSLRIDAALGARRHLYVMLHLPADRLVRLQAVFAGLAAPTVLPLAGRDDLVAVHLVVEQASLWGRLTELRSIGATGIVATRPDALLP